VRRARLEAFGSERRGAVAILTAGCLLALMASAALAVDLGHVFLRSRQLQGVADLAAMAAVQALQSGAGGSPAAAATATAALNPWPGAITAAADTGSYVSDPSVPAASRFSAGGVSPNAVRVTLSAPVPLYFAGLIIGRTSLQVTRSAVAATAQYAAFSIGSGLASLNGGIANAMLSALTGSQVTLSAANYQALAGAKVSLLAYMPALATRANLQAMSYNQMLQTSVAPSAALGAMADVLAANGQPAAAAAAQSVAAAATGLPPSPLSSLLDLGPYGAQDHSGAGGLGLNVNAMSLAEAVLAAANGSRQLSIGLNAVAPGISQISLTLAIGQRPNHSPWLTVTDSSQVIIRTNQLRLYLQAGLSPGLLGIATAGAPLTLPVYLEAASAEAKLQSISCPSSPADQGFDLQVQPSLGTLAIAKADTSQLSNFSASVPLSTATLVSAPLLTVTAYGQVTLGGGDAAWQPVHFSEADITAGAMKSVFAQDIAQASVASLLTETTVSAQSPLGPVAFGGQSAGPVVQGLLTAAAPTLDQVILQVEALSGVRLGEGDVWPDGLRCNGAALMA
jgi:uncharacterized membrane protein